MSVLIFMAIAFVAAFLKGVTGTGLGTAVVSIATLVIGVKQAVVLATLLSFYSGLGMIRAGNVSIKSHYYLVVCGSVLSGTVIGAQLLKVMTVPFVEIFMAGMLLVVGTMFVFELSITSPKELLDAPPERASVLDAAMAFCAGLSTGFIGISLPVLFFHFGRYLSKQVLRHFIVLLFVPSALIQIIIFSLNGLISVSIFSTSLLVLPALFIGLFLGNKVFHLLSERRFRQCLGIFLYCVAFKLILQ